MKLTRRSMLAGSLAGGLLVASRIDRARAKETSAAIGLGFSLYGMRTLKIPHALEVCSKIGYDCVELPVQAGWPGDSATLTLADQNQIRDKLKQTGLRMSALMENLHAVVDDHRHESNLARLRAAGMFGHHLSPRKAPVIETILGGKPEQWNDIKEQIVQRLRDWAKVAEESKTVVAIKAHVGGAMHRPEHPVWVAQQVNSPWLKCAYDYSHFELRDIDMADSVSTLIPQSVFVHVKDSQGDANKVRFLLPGDGRVDYVKLLSMIAKAGYQNDIVVEVSGQIHGRPDYKPIESARRCYENLAPAFKQANVQRG